MNIIKSYRYIPVYDNNYHKVQQDKTNLNQVLKSNCNDKSHQKIIERNIVEYTTDISSWKTELFSIIDKLNCYDLSNQLNTGENFKANDELFEIIKVAIIKSARLKNKKITKILLNYFQENFPNTKLLGFDNPLHHAICANDCEMVNFLLKEGFYSNEISDYDIIYSEQLIPLNKAVAFGNIAIVNRLLSKEKNLNEVISNYKNPLLIATKHGHIEIMKVLLAKGAKANAFTGDKTPLYQATFRGNLQAVELLLSFGADPNCRRYGKETAIYVAAQNGYTDIVKALLAKKINRTIVADPNAISSGKDTPLYVAVDNNDVKTARRLLESGANPNAHTSGSDTPWYVANKHNNQEMLMLLLKYHAITS